MMKPLFCFARREHDMRVSQEKVRLFMEWIGDVTNERPTTVDSSTARRRYTLIEEELREYVEANDRGDVVGVADALGDLLYTVLGLAVLHGMDAQPVFDEVHASNMTKETVPPEERVGRDALKLCRKGEAFKPPRIAELLLIQTTGVAEPETK